MLLVKISKKIRFNKKIINYHIIRFVLFGEIFVITLSPINGYATIKFANYKLFQNYSILNRNNQSIS